MIWGTQRSTEGGDREDLCVEMQQLPGSGWLSGPQIEMD